MIPGNTRERCRSKGQTVSTTAYSADLPLSTVGILPRWSGNSHARLAHSMSTSYLIICVSLFSGFRYFHILPHTEVAASFSFSAFKQTFFFYFQVIFCPVRRENWADFSRNEPDYCRRGTQGVISLLGGRSCKISECVAHFKGLLPGKKVMITRKRKEERKPV